MVALLEHLDQFAGLGVPFAGVLLSQVAFKPADPHEAPQGDKGRLEHAGVSLKQFGLGFSGNPSDFRIAPLEHHVGALVAAQVGQGLPVGALLPVVTTHAVLIQHGLNFVLEAEAAHRPVPRLDWRGGPAAGLLVGLPHRRVIGPLVAAGAGDNLTRHGGGPASHPLQGPAPIVQGLEGNGDVGGHGEKGRPVVLHRDRAEYPLGFPWSVGAHAIVDAHDLLIGEVIRVQAKCLHRADRDALEARSGVYVIQKDHRILAREVGPIGDRRRRHGLTQRNRLE